MAGVYDRSALMPQRREALQNWADHLARIVGEAEDAVIVELQPAR